MRTAAKIKHGGRTLNWHRHRSMFSVEELFSLSYQLVASISLLHRLREQSFVTVDCRDAWVFCLEDKQRGLSTRYVLNGETVESRCNSQGASGLLQFTVFFLTSLEFVIFFVAVYIIKKGNIDSSSRERLLSKMTSVLLILTGILTSILLLLPLMEYRVLSAANSARGGVFDKIFHSPTRVFVSCIISLVTTPLRSILQAQYAVELDLTRMHPNFTCVDPSLEGGVQAKCPSTGMIYHGASALAHVQAEPSTCKETFYCADDCDVAFPQIVISSLCVIFASFALCYRLLKLRHSGVSHEERTAYVEKQAVGLEEPRYSTAVATNTDCKDYNDAATSTTLDHSAIMKGNAVAGTRNSKLPAADYERQSFAELKRTESDAGHGSERNSRAKDSKSNGHDGASDGGNVHRQCEEVKGWRSKNGAGTRRSENGLVKRGNGRIHSSIREDTLERLEELQRHSSSSEELGDVVLVEDDGEYYMSGFRL